MYMLMSFSGSSDSRCSSCATTTFATWSSIGVPTKITRSRSRREEISTAPSPRASCSTTIGTIGMSVALLAAEPAQQGGPREAPVVAEPARGEVAGLGHRRQHVALDLEQVGRLAEREHLGRPGRQERGAPDRHRVVHLDHLRAPPREARRDLHVLDQAGDQVLLGDLQLEGRAVELVGVRLRDPYVEGCALLV